MKIVWNPEEKDSNIQDTPELPVMVGLLERFLYTTSLQIGHPSFIGVWLAFKSCWSMEGMDKC